MEGVYGTESDEDMIFERSAHRARRIKAYSDKWDLIPNTECIIRLATFMDSDGHVVRHCRAVSDVESEHNIVYINFPRHTDARGGLDNGQEESFITITLG